MYTPRTSANSVNNTLCERREFSEMYYAAISCVTGILVISQVVTITVFAVAWRRQKRNFHQQLQRSKSSLTGHFHKLVLILQPCNINIIMYPCSAYVGL